MSDMTGHDITCDAFADALADYLEGDLGDVRRQAMDAHAARCESCRTLVADLRRMTDDAAALPLLVPPRDLWTGIAGRIDAAVLPLDTARPTRSRRVRPALAAAALVILTAGVTHLLTRVSMSPTVVAAMPRATAPAAEVTVAPPPVPDSAPAPSAQLASATSAAELHSEAGARRRPPHAAARREGRGTVRLARADPLLHDAEPVYREEISELRRIVRERRAQLDPHTVAVLEQSVAVIDSAIAQSRAALAKDPASGLLATQLNHSLEKKVELLRTAASLPARS